MDPAHRACRDRAQTAPATLREMICGGRETSRCSRCPSTATTTLVGRAAGGRPRRPCGRSVRRLSRLVRARTTCSPCSARASSSSRARGWRMATPKWSLERIRGAFAMPVEVGGEVVSFPVTIGVAARMSDDRSARGHGPGVAEADLARRTAPEVGLLDPCRAVELDPAGLGSARDGRGRRRVLRPVLGPRGARPPGSSRST